MKIIAVLNQKGGAGKTTISTHLARAFQLSGSNILLIDSDPQGSASDWGAARDDQPVPVVAINRPTIERDIKAISHGKDWIIIDGAPQVHDLAISAIKAADLIIIPVQPSPYDIWATSELVDQVKARIEITDGKLKAAFLISRAIKGTNIGQDVSDVLAGYGLPVLNARTHQRVIYPTSAASGNTVFDENPNCAAAQEIHSIVKEIVALFR